MSADAWRENVERARAGITPFHSSVIEERDDDRAYIRSSRHAPACAKCAGEAALAALTAQMEELQRRGDDWQKMAAAEVEITKARVEELGAALHAQATQTLCANEGWANQKARVEELERALATEARLRIKDCEDRNAYKRRADIAEQALRQIAGRDSRSRPADGTFEPITADTDMRTIARAALASDEAGSALTDSPEGV